MCWGVGAGVLASHLILHRDTTAIYRELANLRERMAKLEGAVEGFMRGTDPAGRGINPLRQHQPQNPPGEPSRAGRVHGGAAGLLTQIPELGRLDAKAVASLAGLAPVTRKSGAWQGRSFIQDGRPRARRLRHMPALAAIRYNPDLCAKYRQLVAEGKPRKVAVVAVMRKRLVLANALLEQDRCWLPERPGRDSAPFVAA